MEQQWESKYTRVTEVLAPFSGLNHINREILNRAAERGTQVHLICDAIISGMGCPEIPDNLAGYIQSFRLWGQHDFIPKPNRFFCDELLITGECDGIYKDGDELTLIDFKTSAKKNDTWLLQGAAYAYLAKNSGYNIRRVSFIKLSKEGNFPEIYNYTKYDIDQGFEDFKKLLWVYEKFFKGAKNGQPDCSQI